MVMAGVEAFAAGTAQSTVFDALSTTLSKAWKTEIDHGCAITCEDSDTVVHRVVIAGKSVTLTFASR